jgi:hypothetical protein
VTRPTPLLDFFRRGEVARDVRLVAARGALAPCVHEQLAILIYLLDDQDADIREAASETVRRIPEVALKAYLGRSDVPVGIKDFFAGRGVLPGEMPAIESDDPLVDADQDGNAGEPGEDQDPARETTMQRIVKMNFSERLKAALKGSREMRAILIRDPSKVVAAAVLSSPKLTEQEIETFARMANVSDDILRMIGTHRGWMKNYGIVVSLTRNPKTPLAVSLNLLSRLTSRDLTLVSIDRNVPDPLRTTARRRVTGTDR